MNPNDPKNVNPPPTTKPLKHILHYYAGSNNKYYECYLDENNKLHDIYELWYHTGQIMVRSNYQNDLLHGLYEEWNIDGSIYRRVNFKKNNYHGIYEVYNTDGSLRSRSFYNNGKIES